jgi:hypothetical protein
MIKSSNLKSAEWQDDTLTVEFQKGGIYKYYNLPEDVYLSLLRSQSKGKFFHQNIVNRYKTERVK